MNCTVTAAGRAAVASLLAAALPAVGDVVVLEPVGDNTLFSTGTSSNGAGDAVFSGQTGGGIKQRAVLAFDVAAAVPPGSVVESATLTLTLVMESGAGVPENHSLHRILAGWGEGASAGFGGSGAPAEAGDATWFHRFYPDLFWADPGGDFDALVSSSQAIGGALGAYTWGSTPRMVADVQGWLDDPDSAFGWLVQGNESALNSAKKFASREATDPALRPRLTIEFAPAPCPWDLDGDGVVDHHDLLEIIRNMGPCDDPDSCPFDVNGDGVVNGRDVASVARHFGPCP